jgi:hypothetical protein
MTKSKVQKKTNSSSIGKIKNLKLSIQFSLDGFSFCITDENKITVYFSEYSFNKTQDSPKNLLTKIEEIFKKDNSLQQDFISVLVIHQNNLSTLVPNQYFDENTLEKYLNFNIKTLATDFIAFDDLENLKAKNIFVPYVNINNYLFQNFGEFEYKHHHSILIEKLIKKSTFTDKRMFVNVNTSTFDILVLEGKKLILANSFTHSTKEDFVYYILFTAEQLDLNTEQFQLTLIGNIEEEHDAYKLLYQYIRNINFLESQNLFFKELSQSKHSNFILLGE